MIKLAHKITKRSGKFFLIMLCFSTLTACEYLTNMDDDPDQGISITTNESGEQLISIPISLGGAFTSEHTIQLSMTDLVETGKLIIFGTDDPEAMWASGKPAIGKGQCPLCHKFITVQKAKRAPSMNEGPTTDSNRLTRALANTPDPALAFSIEERSHERIKERRYQIAMIRHAKGEKNSGGIIPHAKTGGEYLIESLYCPNCYVTLGWGLKGTNDTVSVEPVISLPPIQLTDLEIIAVIAYLQTKETPGNYSKVTVLHDWENYFGKQLTLPSGLQRRIRRTKPKK